MAVTISGSTPTFSSGYQGGTITQGTAVASTSGTSISFTGIPSWAKRITVLFNAVSTTGGNDIIIQLGTSGGTTTTGYTNNRVYIYSTSASAVTTVTNCIGYFATNNSSDTKSGQLVISNLSGNTWVAFGTYVSANSIGGPSAGSVTLGGTLDRIVISTNGSADTFDAGSINILYE